MSAELIQLTPIENASDEYHCAPGDGWGQGFATYGGYVAASCYKAAKLSGHDRPLLSAQTSYLAPSPLAGYRIKVEALRVGKGTSIVEVTTWAPDRKNPDGDEILACKILFTYGDPRGSAVAVNTVIDTETMVRLRGKRDKSAEFPRAKGVIPDFLSQFHFRNTEGAIPYTDSSELAHVFAIARKGTWRVSDPMEYLVLISDINPPPQIQLLSTPAAASSMSWMMDISHPLPTDFDDESWGHVVLQLEKAHAGYGAHSGVLVDDQGQVLSSNRQVTAVFEPDGGQKTLKNLPNRMAFKAGFSLFRALTGLRQRLLSK